MGSSVKLGLIARRDNTGLGYQTKDYYDHLKPYKTMVIDLSKLNGNPQNTKWYPNEMVVDCFPNPLQIKHFLKDLDTVLIAETPMNYELYNIARNMGVRTVNVINWEFFDHLSKPELPLPDAIVMPSMWHYEDAKNFCEENNVELYQIHHPVDRDKIKFRPRVTRKVFHIAGKPAIHDRNGTWEALAAYPNLRVITQDEGLANQIRKRYRHSNVFTDIPYNQLFDMGDILLFPRKYGGNCLPLNEALAAGIPVLMPDISPNNHLLPKEWLYRAVHRGTFTPRTTVDIYEPIIDSLREKVEWVKENIEQESLRASKIADTISWETLREEWRKIL